MCQIIWNRKILSFIYQKELYDLGKEKGTKKPSQIEKAHYYFEISK